MGQENVFFDTDICDLLCQDRLVLEQLIYLEADLGIFVGVKRRDAGLGGSEGLAAQSLFLQLIEQNMVGHHDLAAVRDHQLRRRNAFFHYILDLFEQDRYIERHAVSDDVHDIGVKDAGRKRVQCEFTVRIDNGVARIGSALKADDYICGVGEGIGDLALSLVAPVGTYYSFNHVYLL